MFKKVSKNLFLCFMLMAVLFVNNKGIVFAASEFSEEELIIYDLETQEEDYIDMSELLEDSSGEKEDSEPYIPEALKSGIQPTAIIDSDNRKQVSSSAYSTFPNSAVCYLSITWKNGSTSQGTGAMVEKNVLLTAGHNVYNSARGGFAKSVMVYPGRRASNNPFSSTYVSTFSISSNYSKNQNVNYDYAVCKLASSIGNKSGWFGYRYTTASLKGISATVQGYPGDKSTISQWYHKGTITASPTYQLVYKMDTAAGQSGSPVFDSNRYIVGVHVSGIKNKENYATRITQAVFDHIGSYK